jgi:hypothetical protein
MLENLTKSDLATAVALGLLTAAVSELLPNTRPLLRSAIQFGVDLLTESEAEAEAELIHSLVAATMRGIRQDLSEPAGQRAGTPRGGPDQGRGFQARGPHSRAALGRRSA